jgi:GGDEF domain-containing protein
VEGLFWALVAVFLGLHESAKAEALLFYAGTAGLVLVFAVLEHGYDIAYRDELTGLLGRRAFTTMMERLGERIRSRCATSITSNGSTTRMDTTSGMTS